MDSFNIRLSEQQLSVIGSLLKQVAWEVADPIIQAINQQVAEQMKGARAPVSAAEAAAALVELYGPGGATPCAST